MAERICSINGCDRKAQTRGWCPMHYARWRRSGDPGSSIPVIQRYTGSSCSVDGCETRAVSRGLCRLHYGRLYKTGSVEYRPPTPTDLLQAKYVTDAAAGCWMWTAYINPDGYGMFKHRGAMRLAHGASYELHIGPVPDGLELDHLCRNRACVNPDHLEPVPHKVNVQRAKKSSSSTGIRGVSRRGNSYRATLCRDGVWILHKTFRTLEEATEAVRVAREAYDRSA